MSQKVRERLRSRRFIIPDALKAGFQEGLVFQDEQPSKFQDPNML